MTRLVGPVVALALLMGSLAVSSGPAVAAFLLYSGPYEDVRLKP